MQSWLVYYEDEYGRKSKTFNPKRFTADRIYTGNSLATNIPNYKALLGGMTPMEVAMHCACDYAVKVRWLMKQRRVLQGYWTPVMKATSAGNKSVSRSLANSSAGSRKRQIVVTSDVAGATACARVPGNGTWTLTADCQQQAGSSLAFAQKTSHCMRHHSKAEVDSAQLTGNLETQISGSGGAKSTCNIAPVFGRPCSALEGSELQQLESKMVPRVAGHDDLRQHHESHQAPPSAELAGRQQPSNRQMRRQRALMATADATTPSDVSLQSALHTNVASPFVRFTASTSSLISPLLAAANIAPPSPFKRGAPFLLPTTKPSLPSGSTQKSSPTAAFGDSVLATAQRAEDNFTDVSPSVSTKVGTATGPFSAISSSELPSRNPVKRDKHTLAFPRTSSSTPIKPALPVKRSDSTEVDNDRLAIAAAAAELKNEPASEDIHELGVRWEADAVCSCDERDAIMHSTTVVVMEEANTLSALTRETLSSAFGGDRASQDFLPMRSLSSAEYGALAIGFPT